MRFSLVVATVGFGIFIVLPNHHTWAKIIVIQIVAGTGVAPNFLSPLLALQNNLSSHNNATVTALFDFVRNLATAINIAVGTVTFDNMMQQQQDVLRSALGPSLAGQASGGSAGANFFFVDRLPVPQKKIVKDVFYMSIRVFWILAAGLVVCFFIRRNQLSKQHQEVSTGLEAKKEGER